MNLGVLLAVIVLVAVLALFLLAKLREIAAQREYDGRSFEVDMRRFDPVERPPVDTEDY